MEEYPSGSDPSIGPDVLGCRPARRGPSATRQLIARCLAGQPAAWDDLYRRYHSTLLLLAKALLREMSPDCSATDELAARVWYALVSNEGQLLARFLADDRANFSDLLTSLAGRLAHEQISGLVGP
ncbi:MAG: hypothetical protein JW818_11775 [Pirellulales bacterium]|nr:hypothetical protein [Pirellulales bacterium]